MNWLLLSGSCLLLGSASLFGVQRGLFALLVPRLPLLLSLAVAVILLTAAWHLHVFGAMSCTMSVLVGAGVYWLCRRNLQPMIAQRTTQRLGPVWRLIDRLCGGVATAAMAAWALALIGFATVILSHWLAPNAATVIQYNTRSKQLHERSEQQAAFAALGQAGSALMHWSYGHVLTHAPGTANAGKEMIALAHIMRATPAQLQHIAQAHGLHNIANKPIVRAALLDEAYCSLCQSIARGELWRMQTWYTHQHTTILLQDPDIKRLINTLTPSVLAETMASAAE